MAQQSDLPVSTMSGSEKACHEATGAEGTKANRGISSFGANVQLTHHGSPTLLPSLPFFFFLLSLSHSTILLWKILNLGKHRVVY